MQMAPTFAPSRLLLGAALAEGNRHKDAAGLIQSAASSFAPSPAAGTTPPSVTVARIAGEEWLKAGQPLLAIAPLELAVQQAGADLRSKKLLGVAYLLGGRPGDAVATLSAYLDANPTDAPVLLAAIYSTYIRHANGPQAASLAADRANLAKWATAYAAANGPMQALVATWAKYVQGLK
jgi:predicted Zn-dependent protease